MAEEQKKKDGKFMVGMLKSKSLMKKTDDWKLFLTTWEVDGKERKVSFFSPLKSAKSLQLADIQEGEEYNLGYNEEPRTTEAGIEYISRTGFYIGLPKKSPVTDKKTVAKKEEEIVLDEEPVKPKPADDKDIKAFLDVYKRQMAKEKQSKFHFIGAYVVNKHKDLAESISAVWDSGKDE